MATYRVRVTGSEAAANGDVHLDCFIQKQNGTVWEDLLPPYGHRTMELGAATVLAITTSVQTGAQKRAALLLLFKNTAAAWGITKADDANTQFVALLSAGFPVDVQL